MDIHPHTPADPLDLRLPGRRRLPAGQVAWRATTSGGPGGQHANRTASRVEVVVRIADLPLRPEEVARLYARLSSRIVGAGVLVATSSDSRDQHRNRRTALRRMEQLIADALRVERPRVKTRISHGAQLRRRETKQHNAARKRSRGTHWSDEDS